MALFSKNKNEKTSGIMSVLINRRSAPSESLPKNKKDVVFPEEQIDPSKEKISDPISEKTTEKTLKTSIPLKNITNPKDPLKLHSLRTYQGDVAKAIKSQKTSLVKMVIAEEDQRRTKKMSASIRTPKNFWMFIISIVLVIFSVSLIAASFVFFGQPGKDQINKPVVLQPDPLVNPNYLKEIYLTSNPNRKKIISSIQQEIK
jgi:hypothetical protein